MKEEERLISLRPEIEKMRAAGGPSHREATEKLRSVLLRKAAEGARRRSREKGRQGRRARIEIVPRHRAASRPEDFRTRGIPESAEGRPGLNPAIRRSITVGSYRRSEAFRATASEIPPAAETPRRNRKPAAASCSSISPARRRSGVAGGSAIRPMR